MTSLFSWMGPTICNYADDTTIYGCGPNIENVIMHIDNDAFQITEWFPNNCMQLNEGKCHLIILGAKRSNETTIQIGKACV